MRSVCGLATADIAAAFLIPEPTMAQRLVRAKRKIRQAGISLRLPGPEELPGRLGDVLRVVYLVFTQGHMAASGQSLVRGELIRYEPTPVVEANRAVAVAMAEGPSAGLVILDAVGYHPALARWPQLHIARAELLRRVGRDADARAAYRTALQLEPPSPQRSFIDRRIRDLTADPP